MKPNLEYILTLVRMNQWSGSELGRRMGVSRAEANRFLNGDRVGGKKVMGGLLKAFPNEPMDRLFILHDAEPKGSTRRKSYATK